MRNVTAFHIDFVDSRKRRTGLAPAQQCIHRILRSFGVKRNGAIGKIPHPACNAELRCGLLHRISETNALDATANAPRDRH